MGDCMRRSAAVALGTFALLALPVSASAATKPEYAGPPPIAKKLAAGILGPNGKTFLKTYHPDIDSFFLNRITIHTGDTVSFLLDGFHTVDIPAKGQGDLPLFSPDGTISGANDAAGTPFWFNGKQNATYNPALLKPTGKPTYDGTARFDTGLPFGKPKPFNVKFTKAGTYKLYCDVHPGMVGFVVVKPKGQSVPSAGQDAAALKNQVTRNVHAAQALAKTKITGNNVSVGLSNRKGLEFLNMFPATLHVKTGTVVTFSMPNVTRETHTATFGPNSYLKALAKSFHGTSISPAAVYPSDPPPGPITLSPASHGNGFANTGVLDRDSDTPTLPPSAQIKFTTAGTYHYICLIHPFMRGTVVVK
jgi:plastocyanin